MKPFRFLSFLLTVALLWGGFVACSNSNDELHFAEVIVGSWVLDSYEVEGSDAQQGVEVSFERLTLTADGRFTLFYPEGGSNAGTYEAGDDFIRLDFTDEYGNDVRVLCEVMDVSDSAVRLRYKDPDYDVKVTIRLRRL